MVTELHIALPPLYPKQRAAIYDPARYSLIEASTKSGKSYAALTWLVEQATVYGGAGRNYWWVAPILPQARIAYRRLRRALSIGFPQGSYTSNDTDSTVTFSEGATIWFKGSDNPDCYDDQTQVLTDKGWRHFGSLDKSERVMTLCPGTLRAEWKQPIRYIAQPYQGPMLTLQSKRLDLLVTPGHRFLIESSKGKRKFKTLAEMSVSGDKLPARVAWEGNTNSTLTHEDCAIMGFYLAEGTAAGAKGGTAAIANGDYTVNFSQTPGAKGGEKGDVRSQFKAVLERQGYAVKERPDGLFVRNKTFWSRFEGLGWSETKHIPVEYKELPQDKLRTLLHWLVMGDGTLRRGGERTYATISSQLADDVQEIAVKAGYSATIYHKRQRDGVIRGRAIKSREFVYVVSMHRNRWNRLGSTAKGSYIGEPLHYEGMIYCLEVPNHTLLVRRKGKICWSGNSLYGEDVWAAVVDEASRCKEDAWYALRSTLTFTKGPVRIIGNVKGRRNWFYQMARLAQAGEPDMAYHKIIAADAVAAGVLDKAEVEDARRRLPDSVFRELYLAEPSADEGNPFGMDKLAACVAPLSQDAPMVWGWDPAKSVDFTVGIALDAQARVCRFHRFQMPWPETRERIKVESKRPSLLDSTGVGDPVLEELQRDGTGWFEGFKFTRQSKQELMTGLRNAIHAGSVHFPDGPIRLELESFEYEVAPTQTFYSAPAGAHDDCVMALALAWKHYKDKRIAPVDGERPVVLVPRAWSMEPAIRRSKRLGG